MAKVLFINPVIRQNERPTYVPYGMAQLVALALKAGHNVQVFDANAWRPTDAEMEEAIRADRWDAIVTGGLVTTYGYIKKIVGSARAIHKKALIVAGGGLLTPIPYDVMEFLPQVDVGIIGEGYVTLLELLKSLDSGLKDLRDIKGIIYRNSDRNLILNEGRPLIEDVDSLPFPAWHLFPLEKYFENSSTILLSEEAMLAKRHIGIIASYGCPFQCKYCFHLGLSGELKVVKKDGRRDVEITRQRKIRNHSPRYIVEMVSYVKKSFGVDFISFMDENFVTLARNKVWMDEFTRLWKKAGLVPRCIKDGITHDPKKCKGMHWGTTAHSALVDLKLLKKLKQLGCAHLDYGLESFSDDILRSIGKGANAAQNERAVIDTMKAGIRPIPNQMIGFPDESFESIMANIEAWTRLGIRSFPFFATPYPGSEWYCTYKSEILKQYNNDLEAFLLDLGDATKITAVISKDFTAAELLGLRELMINLDMKRVQAHKKAKAVCFKGRR